MAGNRSSCSSVHGLFRGGEDDGVGGGGRRRRRRRRGEGHHCYNGEEEEEEEEGVGEKEEEDGEGQVACSVPFAWEEKPGTPKEERSRGRGGLNYYIISEDRALPPPPSSSPYVADSYVCNASSNDRRCHYPPPRSPGLAGIIRGAIFCGSNMHHGGSAHHNLDPFQVAMDHLIEEEEDLTMALTKKKTMKKKKTTKAESGTHSRVRSLSSIAIPWHCQEEEEEEEEDDDDDNAAADDKERQQQKQQPMSLPSHINGHLPQGSKLGEGNGHANSYGNAHAPNKFAPKNKNSHNSMKWTVRDLLYRSFGSRTSSRKEAHARKGLLQGSYGQAAFPSNQRSISAPNIIASSPTS